MTYSATPAAPRPCPAKVAAATALVTAFGSNKCVEPSLRALCEDYLRGEATFFGAPMTDEKYRLMIVALMSGVGVNVEAMENHYYTLCDKFGF